MTRRQLVLLAKLPIVALNSARDRRDLLRAAMLLMVVFLGFTAARPAMAQVQFEPNVVQGPIQIAADKAERFRVGNEDVWVLEGGCDLRHGLNKNRKLDQPGGLTRGEKAVVWVSQDQATRQVRVRAYFESQVSVIRYTAEDLRPGPQRPLPPNQITSTREWIGNFQSTQLPEMTIKQMVPRSPETTALYQRAQAWHPSKSVPGPRPVINQQPPGVRQAQAFEPIPAGPSVDSPAPGTRRIRAFPRSNVRVQAQWFPNPKVEGEWVAVISNGVTIHIDGVETLGSVDVSTDRLVIWTQGAGQPDLSSGTEQTSETPLKFYMEGNIEFRQGDRVIYASSMYYDVQNSTGVVLNAEMHTPLPEFAGKLRVAAQEMRQLGRNQFLAHGVRVTASQMGEPGYWIESRDVMITDEQYPVFDPITGEPIIDPVTHQQAIAHKRQATGEGNAIYVSGMPIFYWPRLNNDLEDGSFYLRRIRLKNNNIFGTQVLTDWNAYDLFGIPEKEGVEWDVSLDYMSHRGPAVGTAVDYDLPGLFGLDGRARGIFKAWGINDTGFDVLGADRRHLLPEKEYRGRVFLQHRQKFWNDYQFDAQVGLISDRNFLQQYYEKEWDNDKDHNTRVSIKRLDENRSWTVLADVRVNDFVASTDWLPRGDHYWLGESVLFDRFTWSEHTSAGYARFKAATEPTNPGDAKTFDPLAWEVPNEGERFVTSQSLEMPFSLGPMKFVPRLMGQAGHWGSDIDGNDIQRLYGEASLKASLAMWKILPHCDSRLFNLHGLAHKVVFDAEMTYADANRDLTQFPLYDPLDDDSIEAFRRRFFFFTFGGTKGIPPDGSPGLPGDTPARFDERFYAVRTGLGSWVTSPSAEVVDDLSVFRLGARQRWQTKRGMPGNRRVVDWITLDTHFTWFPKEDRDNFGESLGLVDYDFTWHVGDRFALMSDGIFDFFNEGQQLVTIGGTLHRPDRGNIYLGYRSLEGPISNQVILASASYRMSPKWIASFANMSDLSGDGNHSQQLALTRLGESFLFRVGFSYDEGKDDVGIKLAIEPRILKSGAGKPIDGIYVPPAGTYGLD